MFAVVTFITKQRTKQVVSSEICDDDKFCYGYCFIQIAKDINHGYLRRVKFTTYMEEKKRLRLVVKHNGSHRATI